MGAQKATSNEVPDWIESIVNVELCEFAGMADDGTRFGIKCNSIGSVSTELALKNGYTIEKVRENGLGEKEYDLSITFARLGTQ